MDNGNKEWMITNEKIVNSIIMIMIAVVTVILIMIMHIYNLRLALIALLLLLLLPLGSTVVDNRSTSDTNKASNNSDINDNDANDNILYGLLGILLQITFNKLCPACYDHLFLLAASYYYII